MYIATIDGKVVEVEPALVRFSSCLKEIAKEKEKQEAEIESASEFSAENPLSPIAGTSADHPLTGLKSLTSESLELLLQWMRHYLENHLESDLEESESLAAKKRRDYADDNLALSIKGSRTKAIRWKRSYTYIPHYDHLFLGDLDNASLIGLVNAAYHLKVARLMEFSCRTVADRIRGKTVQELKEQFGIDRNWYNRAFNRAGVDVGGEGGGDDEDDDDDVDKDEDDKDDESEDDENDIVLLSIDRSRTANYKYKCSGP